MLEPCSCSTRVSSNVLEKSQADSSGFPDLPKRGDSQNEIGEDLLTKKLSDACYDHTSCFSEQGKDCPLHIAIASNSKRISWQEKNKFLDYSSSDDTNSDSSSDVSSAESPPLEYFPGPEIPHFDLIGSKKVLFDLDSNLFFPGSRTEDFKISSLHEFLSSQNFVIRVDLNALKSFFSKDLLELKSKGYIHSERCYSLKEILGLENDIVITKAELLETRKYLLSSKDFVSFYIIKLAKKEGWKARFKDSTMKILNPDLDSVVKLKIMQDLLAIPESLEIDQEVYTQAVQKLLSSRDSVANYMCSLAKEEGWMARFKDSTWEILNPDLDFFAKLKIMQDLLAIPESLEIDKEVYTQAAKKLMYRIKTNNEVQNAPEADSPS